MDESDIFRKLGFGLNFNHKQLNNATTNVLSSEVTEKSKAQLNFFKSNNSLTSNDTSKLANLGKRKRKSNLSVVEDVKRSKDFENINLRKRFKINVHGTDVPEIVMSFDRLKSLYKLNDHLVKNITSMMGFHDLTPIQMQAIPALMHDREILACAPTGSGKTLSFLVPVISKLLANTKPKKKKEGIKCLIVSPTRELASQTLRVCKQLISQDDQKDLLSAKLLDKEEAQACVQSGSKRSKKIDLLISTPNRIVYLLQQDPPSISLEDVRWLIVDESDKLFEDGKSGSSFRDQLGIIYSSCTNPKVRRAMFSATFAQDVQQWCLLNMDNVLQITIGGKNTAVKSVEQMLQFVGNESGKLLALQQIMRDGFKPPLLIFVQSKERAKELFAELIYDGMNIDAIHADRTPAQRETAIKNFRKGDTWVLICTDLMGRGMDFMGVNLVVNYDFPTTAVSYIHRVGRTGRAGRSGKAITLFTDEDRPLLRSIANVIKEAGCEIPEYMLKLKKPQKDEIKRFAKTERRRDTIRTAPKDLLVKHKKITSRTKQKGRGKNQSKKSSKSLISV